MIRGLKDGFVRNIQEDYINEDLLLSSIEV
jgi:hypothetical protein